MSGPEHYRQAEQHLKWARDNGSGPVEQYNLGAAQVHATLALAAATALRRRGDGGEAMPDADEWFEVTQ